VAAVPKVVDDSGSCSERGLMAALKDTLGKMSWAEL
jgi:hypothetical protein